jgi:hypothetical protein
LGIGVVRMQRKKDRARVWAQHANRAGIGGETDRRVTRPVSARRCVNLDRRPYGGV